MPHCLLIVADGVFETMKDCKCTAGSPSRFSISFMVSWNWILRSSRPRIPEPLGVDKGDVLLTPREQPQNEVGVEVVGFKETHAARLCSGSVVDKVRG